MGVYDLLEKNIEYRATWISEEMKTTMKKEGKENVVSASKDGVV